MTSKPVSGVAASAAVLVWLLASTLSCSTDRSASEATDHRIPQAEAALRALLEQAQVPGEPPVADSLLACETHGLGYPGLALATFHILGSAWLGDTAVVRAEVVSVATVTGALDSADLYDVHQGVRTDTLTWSLIPSSTSLGWGICGHSREGPDFVRVQYLGRTGRWFEEASVASVMALADSVRRALP